MPPWCPSLRTRPNAETTLNSRELKFLKNYRNVYIKSSAKREYRDENVFLKGDRALSKLITILILNKKEINHFFKSRSSDIVLLKLGNLHQNAKRYEAQSPNISECEMRRPLGRAPEAVHSSELPAKGAMRMCERSEQIFCNHKHLDIDRRSFIPFI